MRRYGRASCLGRECAALWEIVLMVEQPVLLLGFMSFDESIVPLAPLPFYKTSKFLWITFVTANMVLVLLSPPVRAYLFPPTMAYYEIVDRSTFACPENFICKPTVGWPRLNHTLIITRSLVESVLEASSVEEPYPTWTNVTVGLSFLSPDNSLAPQITAGSPDWSGPLPKGTTIIVHTSLKLSADGRYFVGGLAVSSSHGGQAGLVSSFYLEVRWGLVASVSSSAFGPDPRRIEVRCLSSCWP